MDIFKCFHYKGKKFNKKFNKKRIDRPEKRNKKKFYNRNKYHVDFASTSAEKLRSSNDTEITITLFLFQAKSKKFYVLSYIHEDIWWLERDA